MFNLTRIVAIAAAALAVAGQARAVTIDDFDATNMVEAPDIAMGGLDRSMVNDPNVLGGVQFLYVESDGNCAGGMACSVLESNAGATGGELLFEVQSSDTISTGRGRSIYSNGGTLGGIDLTGLGDTFRISGISTSTNITARIIIHASNGGRIVNQFTLGTQSTQDFAFSSFRTTNALSSFTSVNAIDLELDYAGTSGVQVSFDRIEIVSTGAGVDPIIPTDPMVDDPDMQVIPLPASVFMMLAALGGLGVVGARRRS